MIKIVSLRDSDRSVSIEEGVLTTWWKRDVADSLCITPNEAVNLASALLQYATQNGAVNNGSDR